MNDVPLELAYVKLRAWSFYTALKPCFWALVNAATLFASYHHYHTTPASPCQSLQGQLPHLLRTCPQPKRSRSWCTTALRKLSMSHTVISNLQTGPETPSSSATPPADLLSTGSSTIAHQTPLHLPSKGKSLLVQKNWIGYLQNGSTANQPGEWWSMVIWSSSKGISFNLGSIPPFLSISSSLSSSPMGGWRSSASGIHSGYRLLMERQVVFSKTSLTGSYQHLGFLSSNTIPMMCSMLMKLAYFTTCHPTKP